jgi:hypothetical protein
MHIIGKATTDVLAAVFAIAMTTKGQPPANSTDAQKVLTALWLLHSRDITAPLNHNATLRPDAWRDPAKTATRTGSACAELQVMHYASRGEGI